MDTFKPKAKLDGKSQTVFRLQAQKSNLEAKIEGLKHKLENPKPMDSDDSDIEEIEVGKKFLPHYHLQLAIICIQLRIIDEGKGTSNSLLVEQWSRQLDLAKKKLEYYELLQVGDPESMTRIQELEADINKYDSEWLKENKLQAK